MTEDYVSFETAKQLKTKGFDVPCEYFYSYGKLVKSQGFDCNWNKGESLYTDYKNECSAPTLQMAMKWLREIQALNIYVRGVWKDVEVQYGDWELAVVGYEWFVESLTDDTYSKMSVEQFLTYEEAAEAAIKYCLENLI